MSLLAQNERLARQVGGVTLLLLALAIGFFVFLAPDIDWGARVRMEVYFVHTGELREGAPVIVGGRAIGTVESIGFQPRGPIATPPGCPGIELAEGGVVVTLDLAREHAEQVARGGDVFVAGRGPLSARHLEIAPSPTPDGPTLAVPCPVRGKDPPSLDRVVQRTWDNLVNAKRFADEVAPEFRALRVELKQLASTLDNLVPTNVIGVASLGYELDGLIDEAKQLRVALGGDPGLARLDAMLGHARATIAQARKVLDTLDAKATTLATAVDGLRARLGKRGPDAVAAVETAIAKLRAAIDKIDPLLAKVEDLNKRIAAGEGTIGRLARDPEFPEDAKELGKIMKRQPWRIFLRPKN